MRSSLKARLRIEKAHSLSVYEVPLLRSVKRSIVSCQADLAAVVRNGTTIVHVRHHHARADAAAAPRRAGSSPDIALIGFHCDSQGIIHVLICVRLPFIPGRTCCSTVAAHPSLLLLAGALNVLD